MYQQFLLTRAVPQCLPHYSDGFLNQILDPDIVIEVSADVFKLQQYLTSAITV
jgi:hypothetical protein